MTNSSMVVVGQPVGKPRGALSTNLTDGAVMVLIPEGEFIMGSTDNQIVNAYQQALKVVNMPRSSFTCEGPQHKVYLDSYYIYQEPVTVEQYEKFCAATGHKMPESPEWGWKKNHPIVNVSWDDAQAYCKWAGAHLPTEAQWEKAARGTDARVYPWGNNWDSSRLQCSKNAPSDASRTAPAGNFPNGASPNDCLDMAGNVWQWCADWYSEDYYKTSPERNPTGPDHGDYRVFRGGSWRYGGPIFFLFRSASRGWQAPDSSTTIRDPVSGGLWKAHDEIGFRCVVERQ